MTVATNCSRSYPQQIAIGNRPGVVCGQLVQAYFRRGDLRFLIQTPAAL